MKSIFVLVSVVVCFSSLNAQCRDGWLRFHDNCYLFSRDEASWGESAAICNAFHSHLAVVNSAEENEFLNSELNRTHVGGGFWTDGSDVEVEGTWRWVSTGANITYVHWGLNQPNNGNLSNCLSLTWGLSYDMADDPCNTKQNYICQMRGSIIAGPIIG
ncbi:perlucin-like protein [Ylistrum balloti]|uniref:perlucin-like protein n=1 Tax=Ylistrum balloti TaxID=509963 RepID=UPI0029058C07|nr:perlucin-like protein [Ylistrum balloti]